MYNMYKNKIRYKSMGQLLRKLNRTPVLNYRYIHAENEIYPPQSESKLPIPRVRLARGILLPINF